MTATVTLHQDASATHAAVLALADGQSFITLRAGGVDLILLGLDAVSVSQARLMADALLTAADDLQTRLDAREDAATAVQS